MIKIAFDAYPIAAHRLSGIGTHARELTQRLCQRPELDCTLLLYDFLNRRGSRKLLQERIPNAKIVQNPWLPYGVYVELWPHFPWLGWEQVFGIKADISHFFNFIIPPKATGRVINTVHDLVHLNYPETMEKSNLRRLSRNLNRSCRDADLIVTVSWAVRQEMIEKLGLPGDKIRVVPNGVDLTRFCPEGTRLSQLPEHYFLYLGTLEPRKNLIGLLHAYKIGKSRFDDCKLVLGGAKGWEYDAIFDQVKQLGLEEDVIFPGYLPYEHLPALYRGAQAFLFPSFYEGFGIPPLEAMACGVPVITSDCAALTEVTENAAVHIDPNQPEALADAMERILTDSELRTLSIARGLERAKAFTWDRAAEKTAQIYRELK